MNDWTLATIWNESLDNTEREILPRERIYASELGRSDIDIWLKLKGEKYTNPPNSRSFRKFEVGNFFEWIVKTILIRAGIYQSSQDAVRTQIEECLEVSGKLDFLAGGKPDYEKAVQAIMEMDLPEFLQKRALEVIKFFEVKYPQGLKEKVLEVKSTALVSFNRIEKTGKAIAGHDLQLFHYVYNKNIAGSLIYICRDDMRMYEIPIMPDNEELLAKYTEKVKRVSGFYFEDQMPEPEPTIIFDEDVMKFTKNFNVEYSPYLTKLYNIANPDDYNKLFKSKIGSWNRVIARIAKGQKMTPKNDEAIADMKSYGFDVDSIISKVLAKPDEVLTEEEDEQDIN